MRNYETIRLVQETSLGPGCEARLVIFNTSNNIKSFEFFALEQPNCKVEFMQHTHHNT